MNFDLSKCHKEWPEVESVRVISKSVVRIEDSKPIRIKGMTVPGFRILLEEIIGSFSDFRRALRGEDRLAFDSLINKAREHASSCTNVPTLDPKEAVFLSMLVEHQKEIASLREAFSNGKVIM